MGSEIRNIKMKYYNEVKRFVASFLYFKNMYIEPNFKQSPSAWKEPIGCKFGLFLIAEHSCGRKTMIDFFVAHLTPSKPWVLLSQ